MGELTRSGVWSILDEEGLQHYAWFEDRPRAEEAGIVFGDRGYRVFVTDERAAEAYLAEYASEQVALEDFLARVRSLNRFLALRKKRKGR